MTEAEITKPHLNLMADGSEKHKHAMLSSPLQSVAIGGKLLDGWTTPDFPSVFSHGQAGTQPAETSGGSTTTLPGPPKPAPVAKNQAAAKQQVAKIEAKKPKLPPLAPPEIKKEWRKWDSKLTTIAAKLETALGKVASRKTEDWLAEIATMIDDFGDRVDSIEAAGFETYVLKTGEVSY